MAWIETCKIDAKKQIDHKKNQGENIKNAMRILSKESGIPIGTLRRWYYGIENKKRIINDPPTKKTNYETCAVSDLYELIKRGKKFSTIYADPPWKYSNQATRSATSNHYDTMTVEDISNLPIPEFTTENAHLHLWTTNAFLFDAKTIIEAWGFEYKSCFVWVKPQMGIGNYWRVSHEFLLFGLKGKQPFLDRGQKSWRELNRTKHSKKPEDVALTIEKVSPGPWIELFGRKTRDNWTVWGNEIERDLFNKSAFGT